jgi:hypothetical protein
MKGVKVNITGNDAQTLASFMICSSKTQEGSQEVLNVLIFLEDFIYYSGLSRKVCKLFQSGFELSFRPLSDTQDGERNEFEFTWLFILF